MIFMDPPYDHLWEKQVLEYLADSHLADEGTLIIIKLLLRPHLHIWRSLDLQLKKQNATRRTSTCS